MPQDGTRERTLIALLWHTDTSTVVWIDPEHGEPRAFSEVPDAITYLRAHGFTHEETFRMARGQDHETQAERWVR